MKSLRPAPTTLAFRDITLRFERVMAADASKGFVPAYHFRILNKAKEDVGHINLRVGASEHVRLVAGHLGFEIAEAHRGHSYARQACLALAPWIAEVCPTILITADPDNLPSLKTIEQLGAVYLGEVDVPKEDPHFARGSRRKKRFEWTPKRQNQAVEPTAASGRGSP